MASFGISEPSLTTSTDATADRKSLLTLDVQRELLIALILFLAGFVIGTYGIEAFIKAGHKPFFYQGWFGAAVMEACGRGFHEPLGHEKMPQALQNFLDVKVDSFDCADLPGDFTPGPASWFQRLYRYLQLTLAVIWRVRGVSWAKLDLLYAATSGAVTALTYGLLRLGAGRVIAACGALALVSSPLNLGNFPHLRDYLKAPFQMALILTMGCLVCYGTTRRRVFALAGLGGAVLGIGLGFRPDLLLAAVPMVIALAGFLPLPWRGTLGLRASAIAIFTVTALVLSAPIIAAYSAGGNSPHVAVLGFADPFTEALGLRPAAYNVIPLYNDRNPELNLRSDVVRRRGGAGYLAMSTPEYDHEMSNYLGRVARALPADVIARAYGAILKAFETPFDWEATQHCDHFAGAFGNVCRARMALLAEALPLGVPLGLLALAGIVAGAPRLGIFALLVIGVVAGGTAIQFNERHYFYLEFMPWWTLAFLLQRSVDAAWRLRRSDRRAAFSRMWRWERSGLAALALVTAGLPLVLAAARLYQDRTNSRLFAQYRAAPSSPVTVHWRTIDAVSVRAEVEDDRLALMKDGWQTQSIRTEFYRADFGGAGCDYALLAPMLRYATKYSYDDLSNRFPIRLGRNGTIVSAFFPAYSAFVTVPTGGVPYSDTRFAGIELPAAQARCLVGLHRLVDLSPFPFLWHAIVRPSMDSPSNYQTLARWEHGGETTASPRMYSAGTAGVAYRDLTAPLANLRQALDLAAPSVRFEGDGAIIDGPIGVPVVALMRTAPRTMPAGARAVLKGRLDRGTIIFALHDGTQYLGTTTLTQAGHFAITVQTPAAATYAIVVINRDGRSKRGTRLQVDRLGWVPESPEATPAME